MKMKTSSLLSKVAIFQATCAFIIGYLLSTELLHSFSCHVSSEYGNRERRTTADGEENISLEPLGKHSDDDDRRSKEPANDDDFYVRPPPENEFVQRSSRIGCFVLYGATTPARVLYTSWIPRCDVNMTVDIKKTFPNSRENSSSPFLEKLSEVVGNSERLDYYLFASHDSYIVMDNLREYLSHCDPDQPLAYGHAMVKDPPEIASPSYSVGGTLILSRGALTEVAKSPECMTTTIPTTTTILTCLHKSGGNLVDSRDQFAKNTFLAPVRPFQILTASLDKEYVKEQKFSTNYCESANCLSDFPVAFHKMSSGEIHLIHFLINWANYSHYAGPNRHSKLRLRFNGSKLPLGPPVNVSQGK